MLRTIFADVEGAEAKQVREDIKRLNAVEIQQGWIQDETMLNLDC